MPIWEGSEAKQVRFRHEGSMSFLVLAKGLKGLEVVPLFLSPLELP